VLGSDWPTPAGSGSWMPAINVEESGDELVVTAEVPGMNPNEIDVEIENNILTIRGEKSEEHREGDDKKRYHVWERRYGSFERSFTLPRSVSTEAVEADYRDGVLRIRLPKAAEAKSRKIQIGNGGKEGGKSGGSRSEVKVR
jgi:HSP20 family protein